MSTQPIRDTCPPAEQLAAYVDGVLPPAERAVVEKHLATCEDCYEEVAATLAFLAERAGGELVGAGPAVHVAPSLLRAPAKAPRWLIALAAAVPVAVGLWFAASGRAPEADPAAAAALAWSVELGGPAFQAAAAAQAWVPSSTLGFAGSSTPTQRAFRFGVHLTDAAVALAAGNEARWQGALAEVERLVPSAGELATQSARTAAAPPPPRRAALAALATLARQPAPAAFDLGAWVETARLAAVAGPAPSPLLVQPGFWSRLDALRAAPGLASEPAAVRALDTLAARRPVGDADAAAIAEACEQVLLLY
jgi:hypothetical protein